MSAASDLIESAERLAGCRFDDPQNGSTALAALAGALARETGTNTHHPEDDVAAGYVLLNQRPKTEPEMAVLAALIFGGRR